MSRDTSPAAVSGARKSAKAGNTMRVRKTTSVQAVTDFISRYAPRGATGHPGSGFYVWLLKPTEKGGATLARVMVNHDAAHVYEAAWVAAWAITTAKRGKEQAEFDALCAQTPDEFDDINYTEIGDGSSND